MIILESERLIIGNWNDRDRDLFFEINSDDRVMEFYPMRRNREEADLLFDRVRSMIAETNLGLYALELKDSGETIGYGSLAPANLEPYLPEGTVEVGWRLATRFWGRGLVTEAGRALLRHGFTMLNLDEIVSFAVYNNHRSIAVMERIGLLRDEAGDFDHPRVPDTHPHLKRHVLYRLTRASWLRQTPEPV
ncbi:MULTISPECIES: GNAT family N-acetyltransferase [unclassified Sinorhizobium]|uniref:GNAT family N-acetyltransferase n=1 Tax=unclassified Sinorhizobium TaxID=2613772 RepID=UPI0035243F45